MLLQEGVRVLGEAMARWGHNESSLGDRPEADPAVKKEINSVIFWGRIFLMSMVRAAKKFQLVFNF